MRVEADDDTMEPVFIGEEDGEVVADLDEEVGARAPPSPHHQFASAFPSYHHLILTARDALSQIENVSRVLKSSHARVCATTATTDPVSKDDAPMSDSDDEDDEDVLRSAGGDMEDRDAAGEAITPPREDAVAVVGEPVSLLVCTVTIHSFIARETQYLYVCCSRVCQTVEAGG